jgi:GNAT superfamily N-acetyltransferase
LRNELSSGAVEVALHIQRRIDPKDVLRLYGQEEWWPERSADDVETVLAEAPAVGAWQADRLVGFARVVTDHRFRGYIEDVIVERSYQQRGIAALMLSTLIEELRGIDTLTLFCGRDLVPVYEAAGFRRTGQVVLHAPRYAGQRNYTGSPESAINSPGK